MGRPVEVPSYRSGPYQVQLRPRDVSAPGYRTGPYLVHIRLSPETPAKRQTSESKATFQAPADNTGVPAAPAPRSVADQLAAVARAVDALILDEDPLIQINPGPVVPGAAASTPAVGMRTPAAEPTAEAVPKTRVPATAEAAINNAVSTLTTDRAEESAGLGATKLRRSRASLLSAVLIAGILIVWTGPWPRQEDLPWAALTEAKAAWTRSQPVLERLRSRLETLAIELGLPIWSAGGDPAQTADARPHLRNEQASQVPEGDVASSAFSAAPPVPLPGESEPSLLTITQPAGAGDVAEVAPSGSAAPDLLEAATDVEPPIPSRDVDEVVQDPEPSLRASIAMPQQSVTTEHSTREADGSTASAEPLQSTRTARDVPGKALDVAAQAEGERFFVQFGSFRTEAVARSDCAVFKGLAEVSATSGRDGAQWYVCRTMTSKDKEYGLGLIGTIEAAMNLKAVLVRDHRR